MVGGGQGAFIGGVHRIALNWMAKWNLSAGRLALLPKNRKPRAKTLCCRPNAATARFKK
jgi:hypothetical protein